MRGSGFRSSFRRMPESRAEENDIPPALHAPSMPGVHVKDERQNPWIPASAGMTIKGEIHTPSSGTSLLPPSLWGLSQQPPQKISMWRIRRRVGYSPRTCPGGGMVDTRDLKSLGREAVPVRVRPRVPCAKAKYLKIHILYSSVFEKACAVRVSAFHRAGAIR